MTALGGEEAKRRLKGILEGSTVVESDLFPRLVQALVRLSGPEGESLFSDRLLHERSPLMAALLVRASVGVLGSRAVELLVKGALAGVNLERVRATTEVLAHLGTEEAHEALAGLQRQLRHPVAREMAASKREELELSRPTRYRLLPRLRALAADDLEETVRRFSQVEDREMASLLADAFPALPPEGKICACRLLERHGDARTGKAFQEYLSLGVEAGVFEALFRCLREILRRHPGCAAPHLDRWTEIWRRHRDNAEAANASAIALSLSPDPARCALYGEFLDSPFEPVRTAGLEALTACPDAGSAPKILARLEKGALGEKIGALRALARLEKADEPFDRAAGASDPLLRQAAAATALELGKPEAWARLTRDAEKAVVAAAFDSVGRAPAERRPSPREMENILLHAEAQKTFEGICLCLGMNGDRDSGRQIVAALTRPEPWVREPVLRALKALRGRGVFRWADLDAPASKRLIGAISETPDALALGLVGTLLEDVPLPDLHELKKRLFSGSLPSQGPAQAVLMALVGRIHVLETRAKTLLAVEEAFSGTLMTTQKQAEAIRRAATLWLRADIDLGAELLEKIEQKLIEAAENKSFSPSARGLAVEFLGKGASARAYPALKRLQNHPTEQLSRIAEEALELFSRRHPSVRLDEAAKGGDASAVTLLVVEDDPNTRSIYQNFLFKSGFKALGASEGGEGLKILRGTRVDAVLLDLQMEGMDGYEFLEHLGRQPHRPPVLVITALGDRHTVMKVLRLGANDFLRKPVDLKELRERLERCLNPG